MGMNVPGVAEVRRVSKTITFDGSAGAGATGSVSIFTVTGEVVIARWSNFCTTLLTEAGATATLSYGVTGSTALLIAATDSVDIDANEFWVDTTPDANGVAFDTNEYMITDNIIVTAATQNTNAGVIRFDVFWYPISTNGNVVAA